MITNRVCKGCEVEKPIEDFPTYKTSGGNISRRKTCLRCMNDRVNAYRKNNPDKSRNAYLNWMYQITLDEFNDMARNGCEVCGTFENLVVDHDHACCPTAKSCGKCVRGILCDVHNRAEGLLQGDPGQAVALAFYMEKNRKRSELT